MNARIMGIAVILVCCSCSRAFAAGDSVRVITQRLSFSYGVGIPSGTFASTGKGTDESGYAKNSTNVDFSYTVRNEANHYGFLATIRKSTFGYNMAGVLGNFTDGATWTGQGENWETVVVQVGFFRHVPLGKSFAVEPKAGMGMLFLGSKARTLVGYGGPSNINRKLEYANEASTSYAFLFGLNFRYESTGALGLFAAFDFFTSTPSVDYTVRSTNNGQVQVFTSSFDQPVAAWTALGGITIRF